MEISNPEGEIHAIVALPYLTQGVGAERTVVKTDYPMIVGDFESVNKIKQLHLSEQERRQLFGENAARAVNL